jgi:hypothetical protein
MRDLALLCHDTPVIANEVKQSIDDVGMQMGVCIPTRESGNELKKLRGFDDICDVGMQIGVCFPTETVGTS